MSARRALRVGAVLRGLRAQGVEIRKVYLMPGEIQVVCRAAGFTWTECYRA